MKRERNFGPIKTLAVRKSSNAGGKCLLLYVELVFVNFNSITLSFIDYSSGTWSTLSSERKTRRIETWFYKYVYNFYIIFITALIKY